jgi:hypothetical protein
LEIRSARLSFTRKSQPFAGPRSLGSAAMHTAQMQASSVPLPRLYRSPPGNKGAYALRSIAGDTAHFFDGHVLSDQQFHASYN